MKQMPFHMGIVGKLNLGYRGREIVAINDGARRFVRNHLVATGNEIYRLSKDKVSPWAAERLDYLRSVRDAAGIKNAAPFLYESRVDSDAVAHAIANYKTACKNMKERHTDVPAFEKKGYAQLYQTSNHYTAKSAGMNDGSIYFVGENWKFMQLPKLGKVRVRFSPKLLNALKAHAEQRETRIGTVTISRDAVGEYWVSLQIASMGPFREEFIKTGAILGIDLNLDNFLTDSNGTVIENPRFLKQSEMKLAKAQRKLSRRAERAKKEGRPLYESKNYQKQRHKTAFIQRKVARQRNGFQHALSKAMVESQDLVAAENLKVANMKKNHHLAKAISDASWRSFLAKLEYKAGMYGKRFLLVDPKHTTQTCSACGHTLKGDDKLTLADREWTCPKCGTHHVRDHNAAKNILNRALSM